MNIAIIGAGAAGCFAAANIPFQEGRQVALFEKTGKILQKVKVSGGGRCNVTHNLPPNPDMKKYYPRGWQLLRKNHYRFGTTASVRWFEEHQVPLKTEPDGRMFPVTDQAQTIIDCLWREIQKNRVQVYYHKNVTAVSRLEDGRLRLQFQDGTTHIADRIVAACGGAAKETAYDWLRAAGHTIQPPAPSLFTFNLPGHPVTTLTGISVPEVTLSITDTKITEKGSLLITHWGLSGPVVLRASAWGANVLKAMDYQFSIRINWLGNTKEKTVQARLRQLRQDQGKQQAGVASPFGLPRRLWHYLLEIAGIAQYSQWGVLSARQQYQLTEQLLRQVYVVSGKTTFKEEFVTCGGIPLSEVRAETMESKIIPGLYFAGELLNVDGITGGFNFQHAWSSGWIAAQAVCTE